MPSPLAALSPLDGRYARTADPLRAYFSEQALIRYRVRDRARLARGARRRARRSGSSSPSRQDHRRRSAALVKDFSERDAEHIKNIEAETNHDVKAIEYWLKAKLAKNREAQRSLEFIHFACTSEDINNLSYALMVRGVARAGDAAAPRRAHRGAARAGARATPALPMLSRTHGQPATPTTLGKEMANFAHRLERARSRIAAVAGARQDQRRGRQLQRPPRRLSRASTGSASAARFVEGLGPRIQPLHHADRAARLARRAARRLRARQQRAARPRPRPVGLHLARLLPPEAEEGRGRLLDHAAQGQPDRLRELRGQRRRRQRAAAPPRRTSCRCRAGSATCPTRPRCATSAPRSATRCSPTPPACAAWASWRPTRAASPPTWTPTGKCSPRRCSR